MAISSLSSAPCKKLRGLAEAPSRQECERQRDALSARLRVQGQEQAAAYLERDWKDFVAFYDFPQEHWVHVRTSNPIESIFAGVRLRTQATKRMRVRESALYMSANPVCDDTRNDSQPLATCPVCGVEFQPNGRGRFCTPRCRQQAFRLRHRQADSRVTHTDLTDQLRRDHRLISLTVYECSSCHERVLGERRCNSCNLWCRNKGIGGECSGCGEIVTISELLGGDAVA